jgi:hypothetical protein
MVLCDALKRCADETVRAGGYPLYDPMFDDFDFRDPSECIALVMLDRFIEESNEVVKELLKWGFIHNFLEKQNWGSTPEERQKNFKHSWDKQHQGDGNAISNIAVRLASWKKGVEQLVKSGLVANPEAIDVVGYRGVFTEFKGDIVIEERMQGLERSASPSPEERRLRAIQIMEMHGIDPQNPDVQRLVAIRDEIRDEIHVALEPAPLIPDAAPRRAESQQAVGINVTDEDIEAEAERLLARRRQDTNQTAESRSLRRRHREAMVLNDGTQPLAQSDIFD